MNIIVGNFTCITFVVYKFTDVNSDLILRIQQVIDHLGLSVSAFADAIGVQRSSISHLLSGRNKPSLDFVMKLVDTYPEIDLYWLLKGEGSFPIESDTEGPVQIRERQSIVESTDAKYTEAMSSAQIEKSGSRKENPAQIILLYRDGSFKTFDPKKD